MPFRCRVSRVTRDYPEGSAASGVTPPGVRELERVRLRHGLASAATDPPMGATGGHQTSRRGSAYVVSDRR